MPVILDFVGPLNPTIIARTASLVMIVTSIPAPCRVMFLASQTSVEVPQLALPLVTITVSPIGVPVTALFTQVWTLAKSGVAVHVGLEPVQAASVITGTTRTTHRIINHSLHIVNLLIVCISARSLIKISPLIPTI